MTGVRPPRSRWSLRAVEGSLEARPGTRVRFLVEATNWGPAAGRVHLVARSEWATQVQPDQAALEPGHIHLAAVRVEVPADAGLGERMGIHVLVHGGARPVECDLEVVVAGEAERLLEPVAAVVRSSRSKGPAAPRDRS